MVRWASENYDNFKEENRIRCFAHCFQSGVKEAMKSMSGIIDDLREVVKNIKCSPKKREIFKTYLQEFNLQERTPILDVVTRWNTTFEMLECCIHLKNVNRNFYFSLTFTYR